MLGVSDTHLTLNQPTPSELNSSGRCTLRMDELSYNMSKHGYHMYTTSNSQSMLESECQIELKLVQGEENRLNLIKV